MEVQRRPRRKNRFGSSMTGESMVRILALVAFFVSSHALPATAADARMQFLVSQGQARAAIVVGQGEFYHFVGQELKRYFEAFSGVKLEVLTPRKRARDRRIGGGFWWVDLRATNWCARPRRGNW